MKTDLGSSLTVFFESSTVKSLSRESGPQGATIGVEYAEALMLVREVS